MVMKTTTPCLLIALAASLAMCQATTEECVSGCPVTFVGDGFCDDACNVSECEFDQGDCAAGEDSEETRCATDCMPLWLGDGRCDAECNVEACNFDEGDCDKEEPTPHTCAENCLTSQVGDGICQEACQVEDCSFDFTDCDDDGDKCDPGCAPAWVGDGFCDPACNIHVCEYDKGDCLQKRGNPTKLDMQCEEGCLHSWIGDGECDVTCNNALCHYDDGDCTGWTMSNTLSSRKTAQLNALRERENMKTPNEAAVVPVWAMVAMGAAAVAVGFLVVLVVRKNRKSALEDPLTLSEGPAVLNL